MPKTDEELEIFQNDPVEWFKNQIAGNLPNDALSATVFSAASEMGIKSESREFYIMLAFMALRTADHVMADFLRYRQTNVNPDFYKNLTSRN
ncbi:MAG: hypothetical protein JEZ11_27570 [Desulfobacterales bacterium]|nr:hypothetical protein [Desulfobacterales bacterium]